VTGLFAFRQVRRLNDLADVEPVFQRDDFGPDMTTGSLGLLESVVRGESGHHVGMRGDEDPQADPRDLRPGIDEGDGFHPDFLVSEVFSVKCQIHSGFMGLGPRL
jgi:hypothetical protein